MRASNVESGSKGKVTFIVTKPIINGISITSQSLLEVAGRMGSGGPTPTTAISRVVIKSGLITVPDKCTFNRGDKISIEFGDLPGSAARSMVPISASRSRFMCPAKAAVLIKGR